MTDPDGPAPVPPGTAQPDVRWERVGSVGIATLARPQVRNAITIEMADRLAELLRGAQRDDDVHVVVLTGEGTAFCGGGDLNRLASHHEPIEVRRRLTDHMHQVAYAAQALEKPLIAAVNGDAFGAGMDITLMADFRVVARSARFCTGYVLVGLVPGDGGAWFLPRVVGLPVALDLLLTGRLVDAPEALALGMATRVVDDTEVRTAALALAEELAARPTALIQMIKRATYESADCDLRTSLDLVSAHMGVIRTTEGSREAMRRFVDQRARPAGGGGDGNGEGGQP